MDWNDLTARDIVRRNGVLTEAVAFAPQLRLDGLTLKIILFRDTLNQRGWSTGYHHHPDYELSFMTHGVMEYRFDDRTVVIDDRSGDWIFIPAGVPHCRVVTSPPTLITGFLFQIIAVEPERLDVLARMAREAGYLLPASTRVRSIAAEIMRELEAETPLCREAVSLLLRQLLLEIFRGNFSALFRHDDRNRSAKYSLADMMLSYINEHLFTNIRLDDLAAQFGISKRHANRIFAATRGASIGKYILERKLSIAAIQITSGSRSIKDIANGLDFRDMSYFCRQFKRCYGVTPGEYRLNGKKELPDASSPQPHLNIQ